MSLRFHLNALSYIIGSCFFLVGSILFHPRFINDLTLYKLGILSFGSGSVLFFFAAMQQLLTDFRKVSADTRILSSTITKLDIDLAVSLCRNTMATIAGALYVIGSIALWPYFSSSGTLVGNWLYRLGSIISLLSALWSLIRQQQKLSTVSISKLMTFCSFLGSLGFLIGGNFFLAGKSYGLHACVIWISGSTAFLISSLLIYEIKIPRWRMESIHSCARLLKQQKFYGCSIFFTCQVLLRSLTI